MLVLTGAYIPEDIMTIIIGFDFASNIYGYIPFNKFGLLPSFLENFKDDTASSRLDSIGVNYVSTIANISSCIIFLLFMILLHSFTSIVRFLFLKWRDDEDWINKFSNWLVGKIFNMMTFDFYIRNVMEMSQFLLISSINEITVNNTSDTHKSISFAFSILIIIWFVSLLSLIQFLIFSSYRLKENDHNKLGEFFSGLKYNKTSQFYVTLLLLRRIFLLEFWLF